MALRVLSKKSSLTPNSALSGTNVTSCAVKHCKHFTPGLPICQNPIANTLSSTYSFGKNEKPIAKIKRLWMSLRTALNSKINLLLGALALCSMIAGSMYNLHAGWHQGVSIFVAILVVLLVTSLLGWQKDRTFIKLNSLA